MYKYSSLYVCMFCVHVCKCCFCVSVLYLFVFIVLVFSWWVFSVVYFAFICVSLCVYGCACVRAFGCTCVLRVVEIISASLNTMSSFTVYVSVLLIRLEDTSFIYLKLNAEEEFIWTRNERPLRRRHVCPAGVSVNIRLLRHYNI